MKAKPCDNCGAPLPVDAGRGISCEYCRTQYLSVPSAPAALDNLHLEAMRMQSQRMAEYSLGIGLGHRMVNSRGLIGSLIGGLL